MSNDWPLFMFMAAVGVALFAFVSIAAWSGTSSTQRQAHDRYALLRSLAERPGENARLVLEMLRDQDQRVPGEGGGRAAPGPSRGRWRQAGLTPGSPPRCRV